MENQFFYNSVCIERNGEYFNKKDMNISEKILILGLNGAFQFDYSLGEANRKIWLEQLLLLITIYSVLFCVLVYSLKL